MTKNTRIFFKGEFSRKNAKKVETNFIYPKITTRRISGIFKYKRSGTRRVAKIEPGNELDVEPDFEGRVKPSSR